METFYLLIMFFMNPTDDSKGQMTTGGTYPSLQQCEGVGRETFRALGEKKEMHGYAAASGYFCQPVTGYPKGLPVKEEPPSQFWWRPSK